MCSPYFFLPFSHALFLSLFWKPLFSLCACNSFTNSYYMFGSRSLWYRLTMLTKRAICVKRRRKRHKKIPIMKKWQQLHTSNEQKKRISAYYQTEAVAKWKRESWEGGRKQHRPDNEIQNEWRNEIEMQNVYGWHILFTCIPTVSIA